MKDLYYKEYNMKKIPISVQKFQEIIDGNYLYIDKTKYIYNLINNGKYYFLSRPRRWGKSLTVDTIKEVFLGNKELFKDLYIYDKYQDWDKSYPVIVFSFMSYNPNFYPNLIDFLEETTKIFIDNKIYKISNFIPQGIKKIKHLIEVIYQKTGKQVVLLFDEYDSPFTKNIGNQEKYNAIKDFFFNFYIDAKEISEYIKFFYLSGLTKVGQTNLFSALNHLDNITFTKDYNAFIGYTLDEIKDNFNNFIPLACKELNITEEELFDKLAEWYDGYYFGDSNNRLYNPRSVNNFFQKLKFNGYWKDTGEATFIDIVFRNPSIINISKFLLSLEDKTLQTEKDSLSIDSFNTITPESMLLQTGYLTFIDENSNTLRIANKEAKNALYFDFRGYIKDRKELINYFNNLEELFTSIIKKDEKKLNIILNNIEDSNSPASEWFNRNPEGFFKGGLEKDLRLSGFSNITKEEANKNGRCDLVIYHDNEVYIIEAKIGGQKEAEETAINQIDEKYASAYKYKKLSKIGISRDKEHDKKVYVKIATK